MIIKNENGEFEDREIIISDCQGIYIPQEFCQMFRPEDWGYTADDENWVSCLAGPDDEYYWDSWDKILSNAQMTGEDGRTWYLSQDGDLFVITNELPLDIAVYQIPESFVDYIVNGEAGELTDDEISRIDYKMEIDCIVNCSPEGEAYFSHTNDFICDKAGNVVDCICKIKFPENWRK